MLCLGEALVDLICERPIDKLPHADAFVPHFAAQSARACERWGALE
jgi:fructokinase